MLPSAISGRFENLSSIQAIVPARSRSYSQNISPRAKKFFVRSTCLFVSPRPSSARLLRVEIGTLKTFHCLSEPSVSGLLA